MICNDIFEDILAIGKCRLAAVYKHRINHISISRRYRKCLTGSKDYTYGTRWADASIGSGSGGGGGIKGGERGGYCGVKRENWGGGCKAR